MHATKSEALKICLFFISLPECQKTCKSIKMFACIPLYCNSAPQLTRFCPPGRTLCRRGPYRAASPPLSHDSANRRPRGGTSPPPTGNCKRPVAATVPHREAYSAVSRRRSWSRNRCCLCCIRPRRGEKEDSRFWDEGRMWRQRRWRTTAGDRTQGGWDRPPPPPGCTGICLRIGASSSALQI